MVSTRGGAKTGVEKPNLNDSNHATLRKKPVRAATATAAAQTAKTSTKTARTARTARTEPAAAASDTSKTAKTSKPSKAEPPTTRAKRSTRKLELELELELEQEQRQQQRQQQQAVLESEKDDESESEDEIGLHAAQESRRVPATKTTRRTVTSTKDKTDEPPLPRTTRAARVKQTGGRAGGIRSARANTDGNGIAISLPPSPVKSRATRSTRATAIKENIAPLSPKKITQVSQPTSKAANSNTHSAKQAPAKLPPRCRPAARRHNVSDENAGLANLAPPAKYEVTAQTQPAKRATPASKRREPSPGDVEDNTPILTNIRALTGSGTHTRREVESSTPISDDHQSASEDNEPSADELAGEKTPFKRRSSPVKVDPFSSNSMARRANVELALRTPLRRFAVLGTQQGTPQTAKPYCKPSVPHSDARSMSVARASGRAICFQELRPAIQSKEDDRTGDHSETTEHQTPAVNSSISAVDQDPDLSLLVDLETSSGTLHDEDMSESSTPVPPKRDEIAVHTNKEHQDQENEMDGIDEDVRSVYAPRQGENHDETLVDNELDDGHEAVQDNSMTSDDSIIIMRQQDIEDANVDLIEDTERQLSTPQPETLVWENIRQSVTIPFHFDGSISLIRSSTQKMSRGVNDIALQPEVATSHDDQTSTPSNAVGHDGASRLPSLEHPLDISDFIDTSSCVSPIKMVSTLREAKLTQSDMRASSAYQPTVEDVDCSGYVPEGDMTLDCEASVNPPSPQRHLIKFATAESENEDYYFPEGEVTLHCLANFSSPPSHKRSPIKLTTVESEDENDPAVQGDVTLMLDPQPVEDVAEAYEAVEGERTLVLEQEPASLLEQPPLESSTTACNSLEAPSIDLQRRLSNPTSPQTPRYALPTLASRRKSLSTADAGMDRRNERFPGMPSRATYEEHFEDPSEKMVGLAVVTVPESGSTGSNPRLSAATNHEQFASSPRTPVMAKIASRTPTTLISVSRASTMKRKSPHDDTSEALSSSKRSAMGERFPGLPSRTTYEAHSRTAIPASRFCTPTRQSTSNRPATLGSPASLRKVALKASPPVRPPQRASTATTGYTPLTPHPGAPLRGVVALVDVFTLDGSNATQPFTAVLLRLGAKTTKTFSDRITHLVYKDGSPKHLRDLVLHNKQVAKSGTGHEIFCVNSRWVNDCEASGKRQLESDDAYVVDVDDVPLTLKRRRKSMEPMSLLNQGGNISRDTSRKSSLGRYSVGRSSSLRNEASAASASNMSFAVDIAEKENSDAGSSPVTPAYLKEPSLLIQQTAPINRVKQLDFSAKENGRNRRLTFMDGLEF